MFIYKYDLRDRNLCNKLKNLRLSKYNGLVNAFNIGFNSNKNGYLILDKTIDGVQTSKIKAGRYICRPDISKENKVVLPRGKTLEGKNIYLFFSDLLCIHKDAALLLIPILNGQKRYKLQGGVMIVFNKDKSFDIDLVGKGFDVGDITRGEGCHLSVHIPLSKVKYLNSITIKGKYSTQVKPNIYTKMRTRRLRFLLENDEDAKKLGFEQLKNYIPLHFEADPFIFDMVFDTISDIVKNDLLSNIYEGESLGVMMNIVDDKFQVLELWAITRSDLST